MNTRHSWPWLNVCFLFSSHLIWNLRVWLKPQRPPTLSRLKLKLQATVRGLQTLRTAESNHKAVPIGWEAHQERPWTFSANCLPATNLKGDKSSEWEYCVWFFNRIHLLRTLRNSHKVDEEHVIMQACALTTNFKLGNKDTFHKMSKKNVKNSKW